MEKNKLNEWWNINGNYKILHKINPLRLQFILNNFDKPICVFGMLRGTSQLIQQSKDYYYFDHAYLFGNKHDVLPINNI